MYIVFNSLNSGLGNNGGSRTIIKSAEALNALGFHCDIAANVDNFTWFTHKKPINYLPTDADIVINVAAIDYEITKKCSIKKKIAWWRGHESWANSENYLSYCYKDEEVLNVVNSKGLQRKLLIEYNAPSVVIYQGYDPVWKNLHYRQKDKLTIGCLYHIKNTKRFKDFKKLIALLGKKEYRYISFGNYLYEDQDLDKYLCKPSQEELLYFYNECHVWFAPTVLEGCHNPPIEAGLCGCKLVCNDNIHNGMVLDYANSNTALIYEEDNIEMAADLIENKLATLDNDALLQTLHKDIGSRKDNMFKFTTL